MKELCTSIVSICSLFPGMIEAGGLDKCSSSVQSKPSAERKFSSDIEFVEAQSPSPVPFPHISDQESESSFQLMNPSNTNKTNNQSDIQNENNSDDQDNEELINEIDLLLTKNENDSGENESIRSFTPPLLNLPLDTCGLPLHIFKKGSFCHPYLSLTYLDVISDTRVRSFIIGATNFLFKQRRELFDVIIEIDGAKIDIIDPLLKKSLSLTTEDLRFADFLVKCTMESNGSKNSESSMLFDGTTFEGGDEWLRYQFKVYLLHLLRTTDCLGN